jgi:hypothetical protein
LHCLAPNEYAWVRILHELSISAYSGDRDR